MYFSVVCSRNYDPACLFAVRIYRTDLVDCIRERFQLILELGEVRARTSEGNSTGTVGARLRVTDRVNAVKNNHGCYSRDELLKILVEAFSCQIGTRSASASIITTRR